MRATWANNLRQVACYRLQAHTASGLLAVQYIAVFVLLHDFELAHLQFLLSLPLKPLLLSNHHLLPFTPLDFFIHPCLVELIVKHVFVRILQLVLVKTLLFDLLGSLNPASFIFLELGLLDTVFLLLFTRCKVFHVFLVNMRLLVESCTLVSKISLLIGVKRIIVQLLASGQIYSRLARLESTNHATSTTDRCSTGRLNTRSSRGQAALKLFHDRMLGLTAVMHVRSASHLGKNRRTLISYGLLVK